MHHASQVIQHAYYGLLLWFITNGLLFVILIGMKSSQTKFVSFLCGSFLGLPTTYPLAKSGTEAACAFGYVFLNNEFVQKWFEKADGFMKWPVHCRSCILKDYIYMMEHFLKKEKEL